MYNKAIVFLFTLLLISSLTIIFASDLNSDLNLDANNGLNLDLNVDTNLDSNILIVENDDFDLNVDVNIVTDSNVIDNNVIQDQNVLDQNIINELVPFDIQVQDINLFADPDENITYISSCPESTISNYFDENIVLNADLTKATSDPCFNLNNVHADTNFLNIDCNGYDINSERLFYLENSDLNYILFRNCNFNFSSFYSRILFFDNNSNVRKYYILDSNISGSPAIYYTASSYYSKDVLDFNLLGSSFFGTESFFHFYISDANEITVSNFNINTNYSMTHLFNFSGSRTIDKINIIDSNISHPYLFAMSPGDGSNRNYDINFFNSNIINYNTMYISRFIYSYADLNHIGLHNLNLNRYVNNNYVNYLISGNYSDFSYNSLLLDTVTISNFNNSNFVYFTGVNSDMNFDLNIINSDINLYTANYGIYVGADHKFNHFNMNIEDSNVYGLKLQRLSNEDTTNPIITITSSNIVDMNIEDSNFTLDSLFDITDSNVTGLIYNNLFKDMNLDNDFINLFGNTDISNLDFNTQLTSDSDKRHNIMINEIGNYIGGNLWHDENGDNLCSSDSDDYNGICDLPQNISVTGDDINDSLPLISYGFGLTRCPEENTLSFFGQEFILASDLTKETDDPCFDLNDVHADTNFLNIDCNGHTISAGGVFDLTNSDLNYITFRDCDFELVAFNNYANLFQDYNSNINYYDILDSNFDCDSYCYIYNSSWKFDKQSMDFNLFGSYLIAMLGSFIILTI